MVKVELKKLGLHYTSIQLGMVEIDKSITDELKQELKSNLAVSGLELLDDEKKYSYR